MDSYSIKKENVDFKTLEMNLNAKGTRVKKLVVDKNGMKAFFKYQGDGYLVSESCSEKMCSEIAKVLGYKCAKIELAIDADNKIGILNYIFVDEGIEHTDALSYLNTDNSDRIHFYTVSNIKKTLDDLNKNLFSEFIKIMIFDALVGEQDRHEENWGIQCIDGKYEMSPLYDNGDNLLRDFKNPEIAEKYYNGNKDFNAYINKSKTLIYKENSNKRYKHFELIEYLNNNYSYLVQKEIKNLNKLNDSKIEKIVNKIPNNLMTNKHKEYIIEYLKIRRNILLNIDKSE